jgi:hypothetical protein
MGRRLTHTHRMHFRWINDIRPQWFCSCGIACDSPQEAIDAASARSGFRRRKSVLTAALALILVLL